MSTSSWIIVESPSKHQYAGIVVQKGGQPSYTGRGLLNKLRSYQDVVKFIQGGDRPSIGERPYPNSDDPKVVTDWTQYEGCDYNYMFSNGKWMYQAGERFLPLTHATRDDIDEDY